MPILDRNVISTVSPSSEGSSSIALSEAKKGDPSSNYFQYPNHLLPLTASKLVQWLRDCHYRAKLECLGTDGQHLRYAGKLIKKYGQDDLIRAVAQAAQVSKHPFTFKFVERILNDLLH